MKLAYLFPGQGAQYAGMGRDLYENSAPARRVFEIADDLLGFSLSRLCFEGSLEELTLTKNCQPAIVTVSLAAQAALNAQRPDLGPAYTAGLSLGEYSALAAAGVFSVSEAIYLSKKRGEFMQEAAQKYPGKMSCVLGLDLAQTRDICQEAGCQVANLNCPGQIIISGTSASVDEACRLAMEKGARRCMSLEVSGAFHSSLMDEAASGLKEIIEEIDFHPPKIPVVSNVDAQECSRPELIKQNLIKQVNSATYWQDSMEYLLRKNAGIFLEVGPGSVLKGLMKKIDAAAPVYTLGKWTEIQEAKIEQEIRS